MSTYTLESYADLLTRAFAPGRLPADRPRTVIDTTDKGKTILEFTLPNPYDPRRSVSLTAESYRGSVTRCALWFGQAEITAALDPEDAVPAITEIIEGHIIAVVRYKTRDAYDSRRKASSGIIERLFQIPDDERELSALVDKIRRPASFAEKLTATATGVFEVYSWETVETFDR